MALLCCSLLVLAQLSASSSDFVFLETFETDVFESGKWIKSSISKYLGQPINITSGQSPAAGFENDAGVQLTQEMKYYGFGSKFPEPILTKGKDLIIQYEVKFEETLTCGGAYIKLPRAGEASEISKLDSDTPYTIMFGPDRCGSNNKVHFIIQYQNPVNLEWEEKHLNETIPIRSDKKTHLYSLVIHKDSRFEIFIDSVSVKKGSLLTHMAPAINPPAEIDDPTDTKPADWVDEAQIVDASAVKPDDWDETQPRQIPDPKAVKPVGWLDDGPLKIPDPQAQKPVDWDDEEDGEWEAPLVENPACKIGCGVWSPPSIANPKYKGKWLPPKIPNPDYKGPWSPRKIPNPAYFEDRNPVDNLAPIGGIAVEVWTTNAAILFDNFLVSHSTQAASDYAAKTFKLKAVAEIKKEKEEEKSQKVKQRIIDFFEIYPMALYGTIAAIVLSFFYALVFGGQNVKAKKRRVSDGETERVDVQEREVADAADAASTEASSNVDTLPPNDEKQQPSEQKE